MPTSRLLFPFPSVVLMEKFTRSTRSSIGVNGWLSLPPDAIDQLDLVWKRRGRAILGDGSECIFNVFEAEVFWDGVPRTIPIDEADSDPLVGMSLMEGYQLTVQIWEGGNVELQRVQ
jgi:predicted aspartyl protease